MASVEESIYAQLVSDTVLSGLIADRLYPNQLPPEDGPLPWAFYTISESEPEEGLIPNGLTKGVLEFDVLANDYDGMKAVADAIYSRLHAWRGGQVRRVLWAGTTNGVRAEGYHSQLTFNFWGTQATVIPVAGSAARIVAGDGVIDFYPDGSGLVLELTPEGVYNGGTYYGDGSGLTNLPTPPPTTPGGSSGQLQFNSAGAFGGTTAAVYSASGTHITVTAQAAARIPVAVKEAVGQTADALQVLDSTGAVRVSMGGGSGSPFVSLKPGSRSYTFSSYDAGGELRFSRSDSGNGLRVMPNTDAVTFGGVVNNTDLYLSQSNALFIALTPREAGGTNWVQFGRRYSDSNAAVGTSVECWPRTGQTTPALCVVPPGGGTTGAGPGTYTWAVMPGGGMIVASLADSAATAGMLYYSTTGAKLAFKDPGGTVHYLY